MRTPDERFIPSLDGLRAISVALVIAAHLRHSETAPGFLNQMLRYVDGTTGVRIFFVISGFLITTLLLKEKAKGGANLGRFYLRRFVRLFPVQFAFVVALAILTLSTGLEVTGCQFATALTYTKNYGCGGWIDGHLWSLAVEEQFYLLWPLLLLRLPRKWAVSAALVLIIVSPASRAIEYLLGARNSFLWLTSNSDALMIGCILAMLPQALIQRFAAWQPWAGRALATLILIVPTILAEHLLLGVFTVTIGPTAQALAAAYLIASLTAVKAGISFRALNWAPIRMVGILSYSLYVWQQIFFSRAEVFALSEAPWPLRFPFNVFLAIATAIASYMLIEKPFSGLRHRLRAPQERRGGAP